MKCFAHTVAAIILLASCCTNTVKGNEMGVHSMVDSVGGDYTANAAAIEGKKQDNKYFLYCRCHYESIGCMYWSLHESSSW